MYARRVVGPTRPVVFVPSGMAPTACGGCREVHALNRHGACFKCMTWYCPCCEREYEANKKELDRKMKLANQPGVEALQEQAADNGFILGIGLGIALLGMALLESGFAVFLCFILAAVSTLRHLHHRGLFYGAGFEMKVTRREDFQR